MHSHPSTHPLCYHALTYLISVTHTQYQFNERLMHLCRARSRVIPVSRLEGREIEGLVRFGQTKAFETHGSSPEMLKARAKAATVVAMQP